jgi:hypothetical protein
MDGKHFAMASRGVAVDRPWPARPVLLVSLMVVAATGPQVFSLAPTPAPAGWAFGVSAIMGFVSALALIQQRLDPRLSAPVSRRAPGAVEIDGDTLSVIIGGKRRTYRRSAIVEGWLERLASRSSVVLATEKGDLVSIEVEGVADARRLLGAAGVSADRQVMKTRIAPIFSRHPAAGCLVIPASLVVTVSFIVALVAMIVIGHDVLHGVMSWHNERVWKTLATLIVFALGFAGIVLGLVPPQLVIGNDGVTIRGPLRRRFVPYARVAQVRRAGHAVELALRGGDVVRLPVEDRFTNASESVNPVREAIFDRICEAMESGAGASSAAALGALDRAGRSLAAWREHLAALGQGRADYRRIALSRDDIAAVLADAAAPRERRVAAAIALARTDDAEMKARVRVAADACADEALRRALEAAAEDELSEAALAEALREKR